MKRLILSLMIVCLSSVVMAEQVMKPDEVITAYRKALNNSSDFEAKQKEAALKLIDSAIKADEDKGEALVETLGELYPNFGKGVEAVLDDEIDTAEKILRSMTKGKDAYLTTHVMYFLARAYVNNEQFEKAKPLLEEVCGVKGLNHIYMQGEAMFLLAVAQKQTLQYKSAKETLDKFSKTYSKTAPEPMVIGAQVMNMELENIIKNLGSLEDVTEHMKWSGRRLGNEETGKKTQEKQIRTIAMLDKLIKEAEDKENQGGGGGGGGGGSESKPGPGGPAGGNNPSGPAADSSAPGGKSPEARLKDKERVSKGGEAWNKLKEHERDDVKSTAKSKVPERYRTLTEQYYKSLSNGRTRERNTED